VTPTYCKRHLIHGMQNFEKYDTCNNKDEAVNPHYLLR